MISQTITWTWVQRVKDAEGKWSGAAKQYSATYEHRGYELTDAELRDEIESKIDADGRWPNGISALQTEYIGEPFEGLPEADRESLLDRTRESAAYAGEVYSEALLREPIRTVTRMRDALGRWTTDVSKAVTTETYGQDVRGRLTRETLEEWDARMGGLLSAFNQLLGAYEEAQETMIMDYGDFDDFHIDETAYTEAEG